jgi:hypothetical protein
LIDIVVYINNWRDNMKIAVVGGIERNESQMARMAANCGHTLESHTGRIGGRGSSELRRLIEKSSFVIIQITVNSHGGVQLAKRVAKQSDIPSIIVPRIGAAAFKELLESISRQPEKFKRDHISRFNYALNVKRKSFKAELSH